MRRQWIVLGVSAVIAYLIYDNQKLYPPTFRKEKRFLKPVAAEMPQVPQPLFTVIPQPTGEPPLYQALATKLNDRYHSLDADDDLILQEFMAGGEKIIGQTFAHLRRYDEFQTLAPQKDILRNPPQVILTRMRMIDLLEESAQNDASSDDFRSQVRAGFKSLILDPLPFPKGTPMFDLVMAERHDMLVALAHLDKESAMETFQEISTPEVRDALRMALFGGLVDVGVPRKDIHLEDLTAR